MLKSMRLNVYSSHPISQLHYDDSLSSSVPNPIMKQINVFESVTFCLTHYERLRHRPYISNCQLLEEMLYSDRRLLAFKLTLAYRSFVSLCISEVFYNKNRVSFPRR